MSAGPCQVPHLGDPFQGGFRSSRFSCLRTQGIRRKPSGRVVGVVPKTLRTCNWFSLNHANGVYLKGGPLHGWSYASFPNTKQAFHHFENSTCAHWFSIQSVAKDKHSESIPNPDANRTPQKMKYKKQDKKTPMVDAPKYMHLSFAHKPWDFPRFSTNQWLELPFSLVPWPQKRGADPSPRRGDGRCRPQQLSAWAEVAETFEERWFEDRTRRPKVGASVQVGAQSPSSALLPFLGEGSTKIDYRKRVPLFQPLYWRT